MVQEYCMHFTTLLQEFDEVECYWVIGNHGALGGGSRWDYNPEQMQTEC